MVIELGVAEYAQNDNGREDRERERKERRAIRRASARLANRYPQEWAEMLGTALAEEGVI